MALASEATAATTPTPLNTSETEASPRDSRTMTRMIVVMLAVIILAGVAFGSYTVGTHHPADPCAKSMNLEEYIQCQTVEGLKSRH